MNSGKLVWHHNKDGTKSTLAHDNEGRLYRLTRVALGWSVIAITGLGFPSEKQDLGWHPSLRQAKHTADQHHHARIAESDNEGLKSYIQRYPL